MNALDVGVEPLDIVVCCCFESIYPLYGMWGERLADFLKKVRRGKNTALRVGRSIVIGEDRHAFMLFADGNGAKDRFRGEPVASFLFNTM